jgi:glycosyltransferase involved in cell wall biosynthesis
MNPPFTQASAVDVSVLVATLDAARVVRTCIDSVLAQRHVQVELLIADGASRDGTAEICRRYEGDLAYFTSERDNGVYDAWNKLLPHARGRWLCFLGADDQLPATDTLARLVERAAARPTGCRLVYGQVFYFNNSGDCVYREGRPWRDCAAAMRVGNSIPHIGTLHERSIFDEGARFDASYRVAGDYELVRREALARGAHFAEDVVAAHAGWGGLSTRPSLQLQSIREVGRIIRAQDRKRPPARWFLRCGQAMLRHAIYRTMGQRGLTRLKQIEDVARRRVLSTEY